MAVELATTISGLNANWPLGTDSRSEGDDHIRLIKTVLKGQYAGDLWYGQRTAPDRWVWNDKADGTGTDVAEMSETGFLQVDGGILYSASPDYKSFATADAFIQQFGEGFFWGYDRATGTLGYYTNNTLKISVEPAAGDTTFAGAVVAKRFSASAAAGTVCLTATDYTSGGGFYYQDLISANPNFGVMKLQAMHVSSSWAGFRFEAAAGVAFDFRHDGTAVKPGGGSWAAPSDERIKDVQGDYSQGLAAVLALHPVVYRFKPDAAAKPAPLPEGVEPLPTSADRDYIGLIAQEAEVPMPEMVTLTKGVAGGVVVDDFRQMDTTPLIFALVNAVKELSVRLDQLEAAP